MWWYVALALLAALAWAYAAACRRPRAGVEVIQTGLEGFRFDMLLDRSPLLVPEPVADVRALLGAWFAWNIVGPTTAAPAPPASACASKFGVVHAGPAKAPVEVVNPAHPDTVLRVVVPPHGVLVVPYLWSSAFPEPDGVTVTAVDDAATYALRVLLGD